MKNARWILCILLGTIAFTACSDEPPADKIQGSYNCKVHLYTRYLKNGEWRDTSYSSNQNSSVTVTKIDDYNVSVKASSRKWGEAFTAVASMSDFNYQANFSGAGTFTTPEDYTYDADISGTITYDPRNVVVSVRIPSFPNCGGKYILAFTNN